MTISAIKADIGGHVGHCAVHPDLLSEAAHRVREAVTEGRLIDGSVNTCGDDVNLVMSHCHGVDAERVHHFAGNTFVAVMDIAKRLHPCGAGQDLLADGSPGMSAARSPARRAVVVDDIIDTGNSLVSCCQQFRDAGVAHVGVVASHGLFAGDHWRPRSPRASGRSGPQTRPSRGRRRHMSCPWRRYSQRRLTEAATQGGRDARSRHP